MFFTSLITPVILLVLYTTFLGSVYEDSFRSALEAAHAIDTVVLDKTGTITEGKPRVTDYFPAAQVTQQELMRSAMALEQSSEHPLARAITAAGKDMQVQSASGIASVPGKGLRGTAVSGETLLGGTVRFLKVQACDGSAAMAARLPYDLLEKVVQLIRERVPQVRRVVYDLTPSSNYQAVEWR